jgi:hypothetical protein
MSKDLAKILALRFIQRRDVKAVQFTKDVGNFHAGDWFPDAKIDPARRPNSPDLPHGFNMDHLLAHIAGERTYGHYLLDPENKARLFCFDIDLEKIGSYVIQPNWENAPSDPHEQEVWWTENCVAEDDINPRELWRDRAAVNARAWFKYQLKYCAHLFAHRIVDLNIPCAVAYSGNKGLHVYGFTGEMPADEVRGAADLVLETLSDQFELYKGKNFYRDKNPDPMFGLQNLSIEVFPKQETVSDDGGYGNLLRLPLGKNFKNPKDPTFFLDMSDGSMNTFKPVSDPIKLLTEGNPFA